MEGDEPVKKRIKKYDHTGKRFSNLLVIKRAEDAIRPNGKHRPRYLCLCDCGTEKIIESQSLVSGATTSCGCFHRKRISELFKIHGLSGSSTYSSYTHMVMRCTNPKESGYKDYGLRGISVCDEWREPAPDGFLNFLKDMGECPEQHVLDRIDPNGNYCKENCRWIDRNTSSYNTRKQRNNTSGRTGVYWFKRVSKWTAAIVYKGKQIHLGYFSRYSDAVAARVAAEIKYYGFTKE